MENLGTRVRDLCKKKDGNVTTMEKALGFGNGYVRHLIIQGSIPSGERLNAIANYLSVSTEYLLNGKTAADPYLPSSASTGGVMIPLLGRVAAGIPISAIENVIGQEEITPKMAASGEYFALKIKGDSMAPVIMDGDVVIVRQQNDAETDEIVIALVNGYDGVCKKLKKTANSVMLISLNPNYDPMVYTMDEVSELPVKILGKVVELRRPF